MSKTEADGLKQISISTFRKHGFLGGSYQTGVITWTNRWDEQSRIAISVWSTPDKPLARLNYTHTNGRTGEKKDYMYDIPLVTTPCHYGGKRWWFVCPMTANGRYCGRRVAKIYLGGALFACRHCYNLTYSSRNASERYKSFVSIPDLDEQEAKVKRTHYAGKPTRKYRKLLKLEAKFENGFIAMAAKLGALKGLKNML